MSETLTCAQPLYARHARAAERGAWSIERDIRWSEIEASRALGLSPARIAVRHILPNVAPPVIVLATLQTSRLLLALATLSFLGLGVGLATAEGGSMLSDGKDFLSAAPELMLWPGLAITITALGLNLLGDGLRDVLDPNLR